MRRDIEFRVFVYGLSYLCVCIYVSLMMKFVFISMCLVDGEISDDGDNDENDGGGSSNI